MSPRLRPLVIVSALALVVAGAWLGRDLFEPRLPKDPLALVPADATAVLWIDVARVRQSDFYRELTGGGHEPANGAAAEQPANRLEALCGHDPLTQVHDVTVFVTPEGSAALSHLGLTARGDFRREALAECVAKVVRGDGGVLERKTIAGVVTMASRDGGSHAAFVARDGLLGGDQRAMQALLAVHQRRASALATDAEARRLFGAEDTPHELRFFAKLPENWRRPLRAVAGALPGLAPLEDMRTLGITGDVTADLGLTIALVARDAHAAAVLRGGLRDGVTRLLAQPFVSVTLAAPLLRRVRVEERGRDVAVSLSLHGEELRTLWHVRTQLGRLLGMMPLPFDPRSALPSGPSTPVVPPTQRAAPSHAATTSSVAPSAAARPAPAAASPRP